MPDAKQTEVAAGHMEPPEIPWFAAMTTFFGYGLLMFVGGIRDMFTTFRRKAAPAGYAPLLRGFEDFFTRRLYFRIKDCWERPINGCPGAWIDVMERDRTSQSQEPTLTGKTNKYLNLGSYNYLGFGNPTSPTKPLVKEAIDKWGVSTSSTMSSIATTSLHRDVEKLVSRFVGKDDAMIFGMGFATNSTGIPALLGKGSLIISDSMNHASIVIGARGSGAKIMVFAHNDMNDLEETIRQAIVDGQPKSHRPWKKILIMVEGIYSMEGEMCPLPEIVAIKKKYNCYLYVDEAHSIGAIGSTGRGICEHTGVDPADVDILMGTFTKSFGAVGGYIAGDKDLIDFIRAHSAGTYYSASISPPACRQVMAAFKIVMGEDGTDLGQRKLKQLRENSDFFRTELLNLGCHLLGDWGSPVIPIMLYNAAKIAAFSREAAKRRLAVVVVGYPATPLLSGRTRICISAGHTREDLEFALKGIKEVISAVGIRYDHFPPWKPVTC